MKYFFHHLPKKNLQGGFSLIETLIGVLVFSILAVSIYGGFTQILKGVNTLHNRGLAISLANEQLEIIRNLPYADVGIVGGLPPGKIPHEQTLVRGGTTFAVTATIRNIDLPFDGTAGGTPNDLSPADNKLVEISIDCAACHNFSTIAITTQVAPKNLEATGNNGSLFVRVFDANGQLIPNADVQVVNTAVSPTITINDVTNNNGELQVVGAPPSVGNYRITVTKDGYSTDRSYAIGGSGNPNPSKPHATVATGQLTQISFAIDELSTLNFSSVSPTCAPIGGMDFQMTGGKLIGTPSVYKYDQALVTNGSGALNLSNVEWDTYTLRSIDSAYDIIGTSVLNPMSVAPGSTQEVMVVVAAKNARGLVVGVEDAGTQLPLTDAVVRLYGGSVDRTITTGQGYYTQTDWSGGGGQDTVGSLTRYLSTDGNISATTPVGELKLRSSLGSYVSNGVLTSSTFDMGAAHNFGSLTWQPQDQPGAVGEHAVRLQFASSPDNTATSTWNFTGPDGTGASYYTVANQNIHSSHNGNQFFRYKVFFATASSTYSPHISDISTTFTSSCTPPGQVFFDGLPSGTYNLEVTKAGYQVLSTTVQVLNAWQSTKVSLTP